VLRSSTMADNLRDVSAATFAVLKDGTHHYAVGGLTREEPVTLTLWGGRARMRQAQFDLWGSGWELRDQVVESFRTDYMEHLRALGRKVNWKRVEIPSGSSQLQFSITKGEEGTWLLKAAQLITDPKNLKRADSRT